MHSRAGVVRRPGTPPPKGRTSALGRRRRILREAHDVQLLDRRDDAGNRDWADWYVPGIVLAKLPRRPRLIVLLALEGEQQARRRILVSAFGARLILTEPRRDPIGVANRPSGRSDLFLQPRGWSVSALCPHRLPDQLVCGNVLNARVSEQPLGQRKPVSAPGVRPSRILANHADGDQ